MCSVRGKALCSSCLSFDLVHVGKSMTKPCKCWKLVFLLFRCLALPTRRTPNARGLPCLWPRQQEGRGIRRLGGSVRRYSTQFSERREHRSSRRGHRTEGQKEKGEKKGPTPLTQHKREKYEDRCREAGYDFSPLMFEDTEFIHKSVQAVTYSLQPGLRSSAPELRTWAVRRN